MSRIGSAIDDGTRGIELGWVGDEVPFLRSDLDIPGRSRGLLAAINAFEAHPTSLFFAVRAFRLVRPTSCFTKSRANPGVDFRCPTSTELDSMANFQVYLGANSSLLCSRTAHRARWVFEAIPSTARVPSPKGKMALRRQISPQCKQPAGPRGRPTRTPLQNVITFKDDAGGTRLTQNTAEKGKAIFRIAARCASGVI